MYKHDEVSKLKLEQKNLIPLDESINLFQNLILAISIDAVTHSAKVL